MISWGPRWARSSTVRAPSLRLRQNPEDPRSRNITHNGEALHKAPGLAQVWPPKQGCNRGNECRILTCCNLASGCAQALSKSSLQGSHRLSDLGQSIALLGCKNGEVWPPDSQEKQHPPPAKPSPQMVKKEVGPGRCAQLCQDLEEAGDPNLCSCQEAKRCPVFPAKICALSRALSGCGGKDCQRCPRPLWKAVKACGSHRLHWLRLRCSCDQTVSGTGTCSN